MHRKTKQNQDNKGEDRLCDLGDTNEKRNARGITMPDDSQWLCQLSVMGRPAAFGDCACH
jgi:hypothetical protein